MTSIVVPHTDEWTISKMGLTKLLYRKAVKKLDTVSLAQWVIGNARIFFTLSQLGELPPLQMCSTISLVYFFIC